MHLHHRHLLLGLVEPIAKHTIVDIFLFRIYALNQHAKLI